MQYQLTGYELLKQMLRDIPENDSCLEWPRSKHPQGYGSVMHRQKVTMVHRLAYTVAIGPIPAGLDICHRCDNPPCFRPSHLFAGTHCDNMRDMYAKGRRKAACGEKQHLAKLTAADIPTIRRLIREGRTQRSVAAQFGVTKNAVACILSGRSWAHI